jgi:AAA15 family ATPase/GTPase
MLIQLTIENFLSFHEKTVISMRAAPTVQRDGDAPDVSGDILRCAAIYGANASGKSNLVKAIAFAKHLVLFGFGDRAKIPIQPFRLATVPDEGSRIEFYLRSSSGRCYGYGFCATHERVTDEWLSQFIDGREEALFEREGQSFTVHDALFEDANNDGHRSLLAAVTPGLRDNQLLLRTVQELRLDRFPRAFRDVVAWFESLMIVMPDTPFNALVAAIENVPDFRESVEKVLLATNTGVSALQTHRRELQPGEHESAFSEKAVQHELGDEIHFVNHNRSDRATFVQTTDGKRYRVDIQLAHERPGDTPVNFDLANESDGTVRLLDLAPILFRWPTDSVFVVDELDRSLHTLLSGWFVEHFIRHTGGSADLQLLFTTHDTNLLDLRQLKPDSIWFAEKSRAGATSLHSLAEYKQEQLDALTGHLEEGYLMGRFGAIPFLGDPNRLGWTKPKDPP